MQQSPASSQNEYLIEGYIEGLPDSSIVKLFKTDGRLLKQVASDSVFNGRFTFRDTLSTTTKYAFMGRGSQFPNTWVDLWITPGSYTRITGQGTNINTWVYDSEVAEQQHENALLDATRADLEKIGSDQVKVNQWFDIMDQHRGNDSIRQQVDFIQDKVIGKELEIMNQMPVSSW